MATGVVLHGVGKVSSVYGWPDADARAAPAGRAVVDVLAMRACTSSVHREVRTKCQVRLSN